MGNPEQDERDSGMIPNGEFRADPRTAFGFAGMISTGT
jgi:hypothetical protein